MRRRSRYPDTAITFAAFLVYGVYMAWQAFSHPEWTRTQIFLETWPISVSLILIVAASSLIAWLKRG